MLGPNRLERVIDLGGGALRQHRIAFLQLVDELEQVTPYRASEAARYRTTMVSAGRAWLSNESGAGVK
jgi:hypothetical protein